MRTIAANEVNKGGWRKVAQDAQLQPIRVTGDDAAEVVVMSSAQFDAMRGASRDRLFAAVDRMQAEAKANGLTEEKLAELLADED